MTNMVLPGDRVIYRGPRQDLWGEVAIVREVVKGGELKLQFRFNQELVHACPGELTHIMT